MEIDLRITATVEAITIISQRARFAEQIPNTLLIDIATNTLYAIGRTADVIAAESPATWAKRPATMTFFPAYSATDFQSMHTETIVRYYAFAMHNSLRSLWTGLCFGRFDRFVVDLTLERFNQVAQPQREQFVRQLYRQKWGRNAKLASLRLNSEFIPRRS